MKQSNQLSLPRQDDCNTRMERNVQRNLEQLQTPTMGVTINKKSTTTEPPPQNGQQPKPRGGGGGGLKCILLVQNPRPRFCCC